MNKNIVYLDNNSTTEISQDFASIMMDMVINNIYGNPSSAHGYGLKMRTVVEAARYAVAESLGCSPNEMCFTSGGTEANNLAIRGTYNVYSGLNNDVVISAGEHSSVFNTAEAVVPGECLRTIPLTPEGSLDLEWADRLITEDTSLVSVMYANNETGVIFPIKEIVRIAHKRGALVHCDAVQAYGKVELDVKDLGVDLLTISGHKAHALPGVGALYIRKGVQLHPLFSGGRHENGLRPGTENYVGIASLGVVAGEMLTSGISNTAGLRTILETGFKNRINGVKVNGSQSPRLFNTSNVMFHGVSGQVLVEALAEQGVYISAGSACSTGLTKPSRTLISMGLTEEDALSSVRFSLSKITTPSDITQAIEACAKCIPLLRE
jgi:cysteine desulfurase